MTQQTLLLCLQTNDSPKRQELDYYSQLDKIET